MTFHVRRSTQTRNPTATGFRLWESWTPLRQLFHPTESADYQAWRHRFMVDRLRLFLWLALLCYLSFLIYDFYSLFIQSATFDQHIAEELGNANLANYVRKLVVINDLIMGILLLACSIFHRTRWGHRYPALVFLWVSWAVTLVPQLVGTLFSFPDTSQRIWVLVFLAQATLIPLRWQLHLLSQFGAILYYIGLNPLLGLTEIQGKSIYDTGDFVYLFWVCLICNLAVYLYERLKRSEFESQRQLQVLFHSVSHDLRTPVMGTSMVLKSLLNCPEPQIPVNRSVLERLVVGSDRQLTLINSLLEAHTSEVQPESLHCQPVSLLALVDSVLVDLDHALLKHQIQLVNQIRPDLPLVYADSSQLWRVFSNLMGNALKHNPNGIQLTLDAEIAILPSSQVSPAWLRCIVQDNGVGIPPEQCDRLFERYARGVRARYMPGLGLGLYLCRQIIQAHGGQIGVISTPGKGTTFWFTLPIVSAS
jgi:signal transduction histidine kinase